MWSQVIDKIYGSCLVKMSKSSNRLPTTVESASYFDCCRLLPSDSRWPLQLAPGNYVFLDVVGNISLLSCSLTAIFCSSRCTGDAILRATKWIGNLAEDPNRVIIGGFHSAMEKGFLEILLEGKCRICLCSARSLARYRIPRKFRSTIESGRLAIVSSLPPSIRSNSASSSHQRNQLVADLAKQIVVTHAAEGSRTEEYALSLLQNGRVVDCLDVGCKRLVASGARVIQINSVMGRVSE
jgi:predicted Rossmann fold nucleotide-binding protein DprA/Smf involved in DNA uptake